ncbi:AMP-binding protein [Parasphingorhabdus pacifica]
MSDVSLSRSVARADTRSARPLDPPNGSRSSSAAGNPVGEKSARPTAVLGDAGRTDVTLPQLFEEQVERTPDAVAVTCADRQLTYAELNGRANRLAHHLIDHGIGPEQVVALALPRSPRLVEALLAVLKAGAAYLPLGPRRSPGPSTSALRDAEPSILISATGHRPEIDPGITEVCLDDPDTVEAISVHSPRDPRGGERGPLDVDHAACVLYRSGPLEEPEGVVIAQHNAVRLLRATTSWLSAGSEDVWTLLHSYDVDLSAWELWGALLTGGRLVIVPHAVARSPRELLGLLAGEQVTVLNQAPSEFSRVVRADRQNPGLSRQLALRRIVLAGETFEPSESADWCVRHPDSAVLRAYGATETTVHASFVAPDHGETSWRAADPVGPGSSDRRVQVLDGFLQPVRPGGVGELYVAGEGLARGYLGRRGRTAERFVADPFVPGGRMYRSGDLACLRTDGSVEIVRRARYRDAVHAPRDGTGSDGFAVLPPRRWQSRADQQAVAGREDATRRWSTWPNPALSPFEVPDASYCALINAEDQYSLWPAAIEVPAGWTITCGPTGRRSCLEHIENNWTDLRPVRDMRVWSAR